MDKNDLIERGYFAKELPPCFNTKLFAINFDSIMSEFDTKHSGVLSKIISVIDRNEELKADEKGEERARAKRDFKNKLSTSTCVVYNIPKIGFSRNNIKIPNPLHQGKLVVVIEKHFPDIKKVYDSSDISVTKPRQETDRTQGKRAITHSTYTEFKEKSILSSYYLHLQLKTDISKFYHSIYTHVIPWAIEGKSRYKKNRALGDKDPKKKKNLYGDEIDACLMSCQGGQTKGIPIGPDTSLIVAEIIGCHLDSLLNDRLRNSTDWVGYRYYDDYFLYFSNELEAEIAIDALRKILSDFELDLNNDKTVLERNPVSIEQEWAIKLKSFFFRPTIQDQKEDIWNYFALALLLAKENPKDSVLKFAINKFRYVRIERENWDIFEALLFRVGLAETSTLQMIARILVSYKPLVKKQGLKKFAYALINRNYQKNHDYELTWALWLLKEFNVFVRKNIFELIFQTESVTAIIIGLYLLQEKKPNIDTKSVEEKIIPKNLTNQYWLLVYETVFNEWITKTPPNIIEDHFFFSILNNKGVSFYNPLVSLEPLTVPKSLYGKIMDKISKIRISIDRSDFKNIHLQEDINTVIDLLDIHKKNQVFMRTDIQDRLIRAEELISDIIAELTLMQEQQKEFSDKRIYWNFEKSLVELQKLTIKELSIQSKENSDLLFDPMYS